MARSKTLRALLLCLVTLALISGPPVAAQDQVPDPASQDEDQEEDEVLLESITVTATKRVEDVQDVPVAVTAMSDESVTTLTSGGADVRFLSGRVPSLQVESSFGRAFPRFYIRGLGNTDFDLNASQPVSMIYDEVVLENPVLKGMPVWDIDRIEILRGPQGTLFGRNTPAGIIKFESKAPTRELDGYVSGSYGTLGTAEIEGAIGGGLTDTLSARFSFLYQGQDDWIDNGFTGENDATGGYDNLAYRLQLLWNPVPRLNALFNVHGWDLDGTARIFYANMLTPGDDDIAPGFDRDVVLHDGLNQQDIETRGGVIRLDYAFDTGTLTSVTGYETVEMFSRGDIDGGFGASFAPPFGPGFIPFFSESSDGIPDLDQFTQEIRFASNLVDSDFQWLAGVFLFDESLQAETYSYVSIAPGRPVEGFATQSQDAESWAVFGSVERQVGADWKLRAGLRFTHDEKDFSAERPTPLFFNTPTVRPVTASTDDDFINWDVSATYTVSPNVNAYGRIATGSRAPSIQGRILFAPDSAGGTDPALDGLSVADTEELLSAEVGVKTEFPAQNLRLNATVYVYEVDGQQITAVGGEFNTATILNVDTTNGHGLETDIQWAPSAPWLVTLGLSYNNTEIDDPNLTVAPCGGGCTVLDPLVGGLALVDGNTLPHAPEWIFNGLIEYRQPYLRGLVIGSFDWAYNSEKQFFIYDSAEYNSDGIEIGARLGYLFGDGAHELALFGRNLTDELIVQSGIDFNNLTGMVNEPRIVGLEFITRF